MAELMIPAWFQPDVYYQNKLTSLGPGWTASTLNSAFLGAGYSLDAQGLYRHFVDYGNSEGVSPNALFDTQDYLKNKTADFFGINSPTNEQIAEVASLITAAGMTAWSHYCNYGWMEGINPSGAFDANQYFIDKLIQLGGGWTWDAMIQAFMDSALNPLAHYYAYGIGEGLSPSPVSHPQNAAPVISGIPDTLQRISFGQLTGLANFTVTDDDDLLVTLDAVNGVVSGIQDADPATAGIQIYGLAHDINNTLKGLNFTATEHGYASINITVTDGHDTATATYDLFTPYDTTLPLDSGNVARFIGAIDFSSHEFVDDNTWWKGYWYDIPCLTDPAIVDAEKSASTTGDDQMCWAATAANLLTWSGWAQQSSLHIAEGGTAEDDMFAVFVENFTSGATLGSDPILGIKWFFEGTSVYDRVSGSIDRPVENSGNYIGLDGGQFVFQVGAENTTRNAVYTFLEDAFDLGHAVGLSVNFYTDTNFGTKVGGHGLTCWGYTYDYNTGALTGLVVSDSDDDKTFDVATDAPDRLSILDLIWNTSGFYYTESFGTDLNGYGKIEYFYYVDHNSAYYADDQTGERVSLAGASSSSADFFADLG